MSIENIQKKILESARAEAEAIVSKARTEAAERLQSAQAAEERRTAEMLNAARAALEQEFEQEVTATRAAIRLQILSLKAGLLEDAFARAVERIVGDRMGDYASWLARQVDAVRNLEGRIVPAPEDRKAIEALLAPHERGRLELAEENAPIRGGFLLEGKLFDADFSLDTRLAEVRAALLPELADRAFSWTD